MKLVHTSDAAGRVRSFSLPTAREGPNGGTRTLSSSPPSTGCAASRTAATRVLWWNLTTCLFACPRAHCYLFFRAKLILSSHYHVQLFKYGRTSLLYACSSCPRRAHLVLIARNTRHTAHVTQHLPHRPRHVCRVPHAAAAHGQQHTPAHTLPCQLPGATKGREQAAEAGIGQQGAGSEMLVVHNGTGRVRWAKVRRALCSEHLTLDM